MIWWHFVALALFASPIVVLYFCFALGDDFPFSDSKEGANRMTFAENLCEKGFDHNPLWKPLFWKIYYDYIPFEDFKREYPSMVNNFKESKEFQTKHYLYKLAGKTRKLVHRIHLRNIHLADRTLYEKTPSEKGYKELAE